MIFFFLIIIRPFWTRDLGWKRERWGWQWFRADQWFGADQGEIGQLCLPFPHQQAWPPNPTAVPNCEIGQLCLDPLMILGWVYWIEFSLRFVVDLMMLGLMIFEVLNLGFLWGLMNFGDWVVLMVLGDCDEFGFDN